MKKRDLVKFLKSLGAEFKEGGSHTKVLLNGKTSVIPRHREIKKGTVIQIYKQLGVGD